MTTPKTIFLINKYGLPCLLKALNETSNKCKPEHKTYFETMEVYFSMINEFKIDIVKDFVKYRQEAFRDLKLLELYKTPENQKPFNCLIEVYTLNLRYTKNYKALAI